MRTVRATLRSLKRDVSEMTHKLDVVTTHLETLTRNVDHETRVMRLGFCFVISILGGMLWLESILWICKVCDMLTRK